MKQLVVPQFLDVETKIIGPITLRQFMVLLVGGIFIFICYKISDFMLFVVEAVSISAITGIIAFLKINGRPVHYFLLNFIETAKKPKLQIWGKSWTNNEIKLLMRQPKEEVVTEIVPTKEFVSESKLAELSLIVDTGGVYKRKEL